MISPCIQICVIHPATALCTGCGRTLDEIAGWSGLADSERRKIMTALPKRMASTGASTCDKSTGAGQMGEPVEAEANSAGGVATA